MVSTHLTITGAAGRMFIHILTDYTFLHRYVGFVEGTTPIIMIRDPELIKAITVKDFDHFVNHKSFFVEDTEPLFGDSLLMMKGIMNFRSILDNF